MKALKFWIFLLTSLILLTYGLESCKEKENIEPVDELPEVSKSIGPDGGVISLDNGKATLEIPAGSLVDTTITITIREINTIEDENGIPGTTYALEPSGTLFAEPVKLTLRYDPDEVLPDTELTSVFISKYLDNGDIELYDTQLDENNTTFSTEIRSFSKWGARHYRSAGCSNCGSNIRVTTQYNANRSITINVGIPYALNNSLIEIQRAVVKGRFYANDSDFSTLVVSGGREYTDNNIGSEGAFYFYRVRWRIGNVLGPFSDHARETVFGNGNECTEFNIVPISRASLPGRTDSVEIVINKLGNFTGNVSLSLLSANQNLPPVEILSSYDFYTSFTSGKIYLRYKLAGWTAGNTFQLIIRGFTNSGSSACNANFTLVAGVPPVVNFEVKTLAGNGSSALVDDIGLMARFNIPYGIASGNNLIYVADFQNHAIRSVNTNGLVNTIAGNGTAGSQNGTSSTFNQPYDVVVDATNDHAYVSDYNNHSIRRIDLASGNTITYAGTGSSGKTDGAASSATFNYPAGMHLHNGIIYLADYGNNLIRTITVEEDPANAVVDTYAGNGSNSQQDGPNAQASFQRPVEVFYNTADNLLYVTQSPNFVPPGANHLIRTVSSTETNTPAFNTPANFAMGPSGGIAIDKGDVYIAEGNNHIIRKFSPIGSGLYSEEIFAGTFETSGFTDGAAKNALLKNPNGIIIMTIAGKKSLVFCDTGNHAIRYIPLEF